MILSFFCYFLQSHQRTAGFLLYIVCIIFINFPVQAGGYLILVPSYEVLGGG